MEKTKSFVAGLLAAVAGCLPAVALAQEGGLRDAMRARMQARIEAQQRGERAQSGRAADNGTWQRPEAQERGDWHRADRPRTDAGARDGEARPDHARAERGSERPPGEHGQRSDWRGNGAQTATDRSPRADQSRVDRDRRARIGRGGRAPGNVDADRNGRDRDWRNRDRASWRYQRARDERAWFDRSNFEERRDWNWRSDDARQWVRGGGAWDRGWRQSDRYDWNGYRASNRSLYHLPRYYAPYGWSDGYRRFSLGARLSSPLFAERYWIEDSSAYRLPEAYDPYRWVRYYNDALLVDVETGEVVDAVNDIFW